MFAGVKTISAVLAHGLSGQRGGNVAREAPSGLLRRSALNDDIDKRGTGA